MHAVRKMAKFKLSARPQGAVYPRLAHLEEVYPDFALWFWTKCAPGIADGSRYIFTQNLGNTFAAVIAKKSRQERKLCTVYISDGIRSRVGTRLIIAAMRWLECEKPLLTVPRRETRTIPSDP